METQPMGHPLQNGESTERSGGCRTRVAWPLLVALGAFAGAAGPAAAVQDRASLTGLVLDVEADVPVAGAPVELVGTSHRTATDEEGRFLFLDVPSGVYVLSVDHGAYGTLSDSLEVPPSGRVAVTIRLSPTAFQLEPILVEVLAPDARERLMSGSPSRQITRDEIEEHIGGGRTLGELLRLRIPSLTLDGASVPGGNPPCVEYRRPGSFSPGCQPPLVVVDGVFISSPNHFFETVPLEHVESVTVLSSVVAGARYGTGAANGVVRVVTRRPPSRQVSGAGATVTPAGSAGWTSAYDWTIEESGHPWARALGGAVVGSVGGLAIALAASGGCSPLDAMRRDRCSRGDAVLASAASFTLPVLGGAFGANLLGRTERSRGRMVLTTAAALMPMFMGYFFATPTNDRVEFEAQKVFGRVVVLAGVPVMAAVADGLFRSSRGP